MSHKASCWLAELGGVALTGAQFRVLFHLCDAHNSKRDAETACFPSQERLREATGLSNGGLNNALNELEEAGFIRRRRTTEAGARTRRTYFILGCDFGEAEEQTPESGVSSPDQTPVSGVSNSTFRPIKLHSSGDYPVSNRKEPTTAPARAVGDAADRLLEAAGPGLCPTSRLALSASTGIIAEWIEEGFDLELDVVPVIRARTARARASPVQTWEYFTEAIRRAHARRLREVRPAVSAEKKAVAERGAALDPAERMAEWLRSGRHVPPSAVSNSMRSELLARGLVDEALLRARQIY